MLKLIVGFSVLVASAQGFICKANGFYANPSDSTCKTFYLCSHGTQKKFPCPRSLIFDENWTKCRWPSDYRCPLGGSRPGPAPTEPPTVTGSPTMEPTSNELSLSVTSFGKHMMKVLLEEKGENENVLMSPITIHMLMSMVYVGSPDESNTHKQLAKALYMESGLQEKMETYRNILDHYDMINSAENVTKSRLAATMLLKDDFPVDDNFISFINKYLSASIQSFEKPDEGASKINEWANEKTNGLIKDILQKGDITALTRLVLASVCYFKSEWKYKFDRNETKQMQFTLANKDSITINRMMNQEEEFRYAETNDLEVVELPYINKDFNMYIALPKNKSVKALNKVAAEFDPSQFKDSLKKTNILLSMPAFDATSEIDLKKHLMTLGITDVFEKGADLSKITEEEIFVSKAKTKTVVKVDEEGSEAAAVALISFGIRSNFAATPFIVNRPFVFMIYDARFDVPLFVGRVVNPQ